MYIQNLLNRQGLDQDNIEIEENIPFLLHRTASRNDLDIRND